MKSKKSPALTWFYILVTYIFLQFGWWAYLMLDLNASNTHLKTEVTLLKSNSVEETHSTEVKLNNDLNKKRIMVIGEGTVFLILLSLGIIKVLNTFKKDAELAQQQNNFLLSITHELKSPMASNRLQLETLLIRDLDKDKQKQILKSAIEDIDRLNALVDNILLAAQLDQSKFELSKEKINVSELLFTILRNKNIRSEIEKDVLANLDKIYFTSIVLNLVENAFKYSPENSEVKIELKKQDQGISLSVADQGIGIPASERQNIFEKFYRIGKEDTRKTKGTGLGLYIVKSLVDQHNGSIRVKGNTPKGSVFELFLPFE